LRYSRYYGEGRKNSPAKIGGTADSRKISSPSNLGGAQKKKGGRGDELVVSRGGWEVRSWEVLIGSLTQRMKGGVWQVHAGEQKARRGRELKGSLLVAAWLRKERGGRGGKRRRSRVVFVRAF